MKALYSQIFVLKSQRSSSNGLEMATLRSWVSKTLNPKLNSGKIKMRLSDVFLLCHFERK
jgi:hypothetical protein